MRWRASEPTTSMPMSSHPCTPRLSPRPLVVALTLALGACAGPTLHQVPAQAELPAHWRTSPVAADDRPADAAGARQQAWWQALGDETLSRLQRQALQSSLDVRMARLRWQQAQQSLRLQLLQASVQPGASLSSSVSRPLQNSADTTVQVGGISVPVPSMGQSSSFSASLSLNYELDLWSRLSALEKAEAANTEAARADVEAARWLVSIQLGEHYARLALVGIQWTAAEEQQHVRREALAITRQRVEAGKLLPLELDKASASLRDAETQLAQLALSRQQQAQAIAQLLDQPGFDASTLAARIPEASAALPQQATPAQVLEQRPDVRRARLGVDAALQRLNATEAQRYPRLSFSGGISTGGGNWHDWLSQPLASLSANLLIPMIDWRTMDLNRDSARASLDLAALSLRDTVLKAYGEVQLLLAEREKLHRDALAAQAHLDEAGRAEQVARLRYEQGVIGRLDWLQARSELLQARQDRERQRLDAWLNTLNLHKALGGPLEPTQS